jgi:hypothetical protein
MISVIRDARKANQALVDLLGGVAERKKATPAHIALAWLRHRRRKDHRARRPLPRRAGANDVSLKIVQGGPTMTTWSGDELRRIAEADDLHIAPFREDGVTYGTPTWIWSVVVDDALYVRGYNGQNSRWYQAAVRQKAGRIVAAGMTKEVAFEPVDGPVNNRIDDAYRAKYHGSPYLNPMIGARARSATVRIVPRETNV